MTTDFKYYAFVYHDNSIGYGNITKAQECSNILYNSESFVIMKVNILVYIIYSNDKFESFESVHDEIKNIIELDRIK